MPQFVLASGSPRRKALLEALGIDLVVQRSDAPEVDDGDVPERIVVANARTKRDAVFQRLAHDGTHRPSIVIAADTLVFLDDHVLSKPGSLDEARGMLRRLSGATHAVVTGLAIADTASGRGLEGSETTQVTFRVLGDHEIDRFVDVVRPTDRAGAYTVDGPGSLLVASYTGCFYNVLGLPLVRLDKMLRELGHSLFDHIDSGRARFL